MIPEQYKHAPDPGAAEPRKTLALSQKGIHGRMAIQYSAEDCPERAAFLAQLAKERELRRRGFIF